MKEITLSAKNDYLNFNHHLLSSLEKADSIELFAHSCYLILQKYISLKNMRVLQAKYSESLSSGGSFYYCYHADTSEPQSSHLEILADWLESQKTILAQGTTLKIEKGDSSSSNQIQSYLNLLSLAKIYILPLIFQNNFFGCLIIESDDNNQKIETEESLNLCYLVSKYLSIYLEQFYLKNQEERLKLEEEKLLENKEKQSKYLAYMNHELRTPISAIIGFAKMLKQQLYGELNQKQLQYVEAIYDSGNYLLSLVSDLLDIAKIEANKESLYLEKILINELCESSLALIRNKAKEQKVELNLIINSQVDYCLVDARKIKQILVNLLSNAVKFTEVGSITLKVEQREKYLDFSVIDTGIGISESSQKKLFKPFSQINTPLHKKYKGTGLGLAIARELARLHGGDISLISAENKGSCFTLSLPYQPT
jgi:signal transduction histidine kinase